ncbi:MAG: VWA domain-containing protein [Phototrophicaceae bacterium]
MKKWLISLIGLLILVPSFLVFAQETPAPSLEITGANASDLPTITVTTNVLDSNKIPIEGLTIADFTLGGDLENIATIVRVENIASDNLPFASVLVIDTSTSMSGLPLQLAKEAAALFIDAVGENDPIAIVTFSNTARLVQDYTTDKDQLLRVINSLQVSGRTALYDAAVLGVEVAANAPVPRRAVILLSDGAEFGGDSRNLREAALEAAVRDGVSLYTIGLGFGTDRSFLQELSIGTNARTFESPSPQELTTIYGELAALFRTQYVITIESDIPADGTTYEFTLQSQTPFGNTNVDTGTIRAPIPVPIVTLDDNLFAVPFSTPITIAPSIAADDELAEILVSINGEPITSNPDGSFVIDPLVYPPASYDLVVTATDVDGDTGSDRVMFETAALASEIVLNFESGTEISEPTTITINAEGQTPAVNATYSILQEGVSIASISSSDAENGFPFTIDPFLLEVGAYDLFVAVENEGGATANVTVPFTIASVPPQNVSLDGLDGDEIITNPTTFTVAADTQSGATITSSTVSIAGQAIPLDDLTIYPASLQPGTLNLDVTVVDSNGATITQTVPVQIAALQPQIIFGDIPQPVTSDTSLPVTINSQTELISVRYDFDDDIDIALQQRADGTYPNIPIILQMFETDTLTINVEATNTGGSTTRESITLNIVLPSPTPNLQQTADAQFAQATSDAIATVDAQNALDAQATSDAVSTLDAQSTLDAETQANAQATTDAQSTLDAEAEIDAQATTDAQSTLDAEAEINAQATADAQSTLDAEAATDDASTAIAANVAVSETATEAPTVEPTATITETPQATALLPTLTPVEIVDVGAQSADNPPLEGNSTGILLGCGALLFAVILLGILWFGRSRNDRTTDKR